MAKFKMTFNAKRAVKVADEGTIKGMRKAAELIEKGIKSLAPVRSGKLKRSVKVKAVTRGKNPRIEVTTVRYGGAVELGIRPGLGANKYGNYPRQPFIEPVVKGLRSQWEKVVRDEAKKHVRRKRR